MSLIFGNFFADITALIVILVTCVYLYFQHVFMYWKRKGVETLEPSFPFGNMTNVFMGRKCVGDNTKDLHNRTTEKFSGIYLMHRPALLVKDPELIKMVLVKDFNHFQDRGVFVDEVQEPISGHLFSLGGQKWKNLRTKLTPTFTSGKIKAMFQTLVDCSDIMQKYVAVNISGNEPVEIKDILARFTTDIIASVAFGIEVNSIENPDATFRKMGQRFFEIDLYTSVSNVLFLLAPKIVGLLGIKTVKPDVAKFMTSVVQQTIDYREKNNVSRGDFMQLLIQLRNAGVVNEDGQWDVKTSDTKQMTVDEVAAQAFIFFLAGFETSSSTMGFCLYELCRHQEIQERTSREISSVLQKHGGKVTYESMQDMRCLDNLIDETLRMYPVLPMLNRECIIDYKIPNTDITIEKGTPVLISLLGLQNDPKYFPNPEKFDPDRFSSENIKSKTSFAYAPFGEGPRACIGMRMGKLQAKVGLTVLLSKFKFDTCSKTVYPPKYHPSGIILMPVDGLWMTVTDRK